MALAFGRGGGNAPKCFTVALKKKKVRAAAITSGTLFLTLDTPDLKLGMGCTLSLCVFGPKSQYGNTCFYIPYKEH